MSSKSNGVTFISALTSIEGEMVLESTALVAGKLKGKISSAGHIKIDLGGEIEGELSCYELRVYGVFRGKVQCNKLVIVSSGVVEGEVSSHQFEIYSGGQFIGQRVKAPELDTVLESSLSLAAGGVEVDKTPYVDEDLNGQSIEDATNNVSRPVWAYGTAAAAVLAIGLFFAPVQWQSLLMGDTPEQANVANPLTTTTSEQVTQSTSNSARVSTSTASNPAAQSVSRTVKEDMFKPSSTLPATQALKEDAMEDLQQMEQGNVQMYQEGARLDEEGSSYRQ